jgi:hypothetical protein
LRLWGASFSSVKRLNGADKNASGRKEFQCSPAKIALTAMTGSMKTRQVMRMPSRLLLRLRKHITGVIQRNQIPVLA